MVDQNTSAIIISSHKGRPITKWSKIIICIAPIIEPRRSAPQRSFQLPQLFLGWEAGVWGMGTSPGLLLLITCRAVSRFCRALSAVQTCNLLRLGVDVDQCGLIVLVLSKT
jgi:hypothetical protein